MANPDYLHLARGECSLGSVTLLPLPWWAEVPPLTPRLGRCLRHLLETPMPWGPPMDVCLRTLHKRQIVFLDRISMGLRKYHHTVKTKSGAKSTTPGRNTETHVVSAEELIHEFRRR